MARRLRKRNPDKKICIQIYIPGKGMTYDRVTRREAEDLMNKHDNITYTSKSTYKRFLKEIGYA